MNRSKFHLQSARKINKAFLDGEITAEAIAKDYLERIEKLEPQIGAFLSVFKEKALEAAQQQDKKRNSGTKMGKLAGLPIAVKDNILVKDEIATCGSKFLTNFKAPFESSAVTRLKEEGAIIIGKTNLDEFGMGSSTEHSALQKTHNPWNLKCTPGGSSGGSGAAVAARLAPLALGTDTGGSVRLPASFCGVVGFKPTYGRVSRYGVVAYGSSLDQIGSFGAYVEDTAMLMEVMGSHCAMDSTSIPEPAEEYLSKLTGNIKGMKIGVPWFFLEQLQEEGRRKFNEGIDTLKSLGAEIVEVDLSILKYAIAVYYILATAEASTNLARFDGIRYGQRSPKAKTLDEVYDLSKEAGFGSEVKRRILLGTFVLSAGYQDAYYKKAQKVRTLMIHHFNEAFKKCDLIAMPVSPGAAFESGSKLDPLQEYLEDIYTISINLIGIPAISIPNGFTKNGMPIGLQLMGPQKQDVRVMQAGYAFQQAKPFFNEIPALVRDA